MKIFKYILVLVLGLFCYIYFEDKININNKNVEVLEYSTDYYFYYGLLDGNEKILYNQIIENVNTYNSTFIPIEQVKVDQVNTVMNYVFNDHPEYFWLDTSYSYKYHEDICLEITLNFNDTLSNIEYSKHLFEESSKTILDEARKLETDFEKEKYVHDILIEMVTYDETSLINQSAYSALVNHLSVCAGYARAFQYLMIELGIPTYYVGGYSYGDHAWNIIRLNNEYYHVDLTWNDSTSSLDYFNKTDEELSKTHLRDEISKQLPKCDTKFE